MKTKILLLVTITCLVLLAGCQNGAQASQSISSDYKGSSTQSLQEDTKYSKEDYAEILKPACMSGLLRDSWDSPSQISADALASFYNYVVLYLEENPMGWEGDKAVASKDVLEGLSQYFDGLTAEQLTASGQYQADKDVFVFQSGFGGAVEPRVTAIELNNDDLVITYDTVVGNEKNGEGIVTIAHQQEQIHYLSNWYKTTV